MRFQQSPSPDRSATRRHRALPPFRRALESRGVPKTCQWIVEERSASMRPTEMDGPPRDRLAAELASGMPAGRFAHTHWLFLAAFALLAPMPWLHLEDIAAALERRNLPRPAVFLGIGYVLWIVVGVPSYVAIRRRFAWSAERYPTLSFVPPLALFVLALSSAWLHVFKSTSFCLSDL